MQQYLDIVSEILQKGQRKDNRTDSTSMAIFGSTFKHRMEDGFPLLTTKKVPFRLIASELEFFIKGITDKRWLQKRNNHIWDDWANPQVLQKKFSFVKSDVEETLNKIHKDFLQDKEIIYTNRLQVLVDSLKNFYSLEENVWKHEKSKDHHIDLVKKFAQYIERDLGPIYGWQWRHFGAEYYDYATDYTNKGVDQLNNLIEKIEKNPNSRRLIVSAWAPHQSHQMALNACHYSFQIDIINKVLHLQWNQRSVDTMLGLPFNIASYGLLLLLLAKQTNYEPGMLTGSLGDTHIYENHITNAKEQIRRKPLDLPSIRFKSNINIDIWDSNQVQLENYESHKSIKFDIAV